MHFLDLPLEIRRKIYGICFSTEPLTMHRKPHHFLIPLRPKSGLYNEVSVPIGTDSYTDLVPGQFQEIFPRNLQLAGWPLNLLLVNKEINLEVQQDYLSWAYFDISPPSHDRNCCSGRTSLQQLKRLPERYLGQMTKLICDPYQPKNQPRPPSVVPDDYVEYNMFLERKQTLFEKQSLLKDTNQNVPYFQLKVVEMIDRSRFLRFLGQALSTQQQKFLIAYQKGHMAGDLGHGFSNSEGQARRLRAFLKVIRKTNKHGAKVILRSGKQDDARTMVFGTKNTIIVHGIRLERQDEAAGMIYAMFDLAKKNIEVLFVEPLSSTGYRIANHMERPK